MTNLAHQALTTWYGYNVLHSGNAVGITFEAYKSHSVFAFLIFAEEISAAFPNWVKLNGAVQTPECAYTVIVDGRADRSLTKEDARPDPQGALSMQDNDG